MAAETIATWDWPAIQAVTTGLAGKAAADGPPNAVVGILRGGMVPAVMIAHELRLRDVRALEITHTVADGVNAAKLNEPVLRHAATLGDLTGRDVLLIDDVAGSGRSLRLAVACVRAARPARLRTAVCAVNDHNWRAANDHDPSRSITYIGLRHNGWVIFPWEKR